MSRPRTPTPVTFSRAAIVVCLLAAGVVIPVHEAVASRVPSTPIREPLPERFVPKIPRTEAEQDRLEALALYSAGRAYQQRQEYATALRYYERALRCDPQAHAAIQEIVPLAFRLKRNSEALRYALKATQWADADPQLVLRLAEYLKEAGDWRRALSLYEKAFALRPNQKDMAGDIPVRMEMGRLYYLTEDYKKGAECFSRVLDALDHPQSYGLNEEPGKAKPGGDFKKKILGEPGPALNLIGECFLAADRPDAAVAAFEKAHVAVPNRALLEFHLARVRARTGKPQEALAALEQCFGQRLLAEGIGPYELLAEVLQKLNKSNELMPRLEKLRAAEPSKVPLVFFLAEEYRKAGQLDKAEPLYRTLVDRTGVTLGYRGLAEIYRKTKRSDALLALLGQAVEKAGSLESLGGEGKEVAADAAMVRSLADAARARLKAAPKQVGYGMRLVVALLAMENKDWNTAGEFFDLAIAAEPKKAGDWLLLWGAALLDAERPADAAKVFQRGIDQKALPADNPGFSFYLAAALELAGRSDEALAAARKAAEQKPDSARIVSRTAWLLYHAHRYDEAIKAYSELIRKFDADYQSGENREVLRDARLALSNLCVTQNRLPEAEEWLEQVLDEYPDDPGASNDLGYLWADQGKHLQRALRMTRLAVDAQPANLAYRDSLGWAFFRLGRNQEALVELEKAAADKAPDAVILDHLGDVYLKVNQPAKAKDAWRRAVEGFRKDKEPEKARKTEEKMKGK